MSMADEWPTISVVMPVYNRADMIERSLTAILEQEYTPELVEVIVVDALSDDGTRAIVGQIMAENPRVRLVDNPRRTVGAALNRGVMESQGDFIARMDGDAIAAPDYLFRCVEAAWISGAENIGGRAYYGGDNVIASAIAAGMTTRFGVSSLGRQSESQPGETRAVPFEFMHRDVFTSLAGHDEHLPAREEYDFNTRLRAEGGRVFFSPQIQFMVMPRPNLGDVWRLSSHRGFWQASLRRLYPRTARLRHYLPMLLILWLIIGLPLSLAIPAGIPLYLLVLSLYFGVSLLIGLWQSRRFGALTMLLLPLVLTLMHFGWGLGFLRGFIVGRRALMG